MFNNYPFSFVYFCFLIECLLLCFIKPLGIFLRPSITEFPAGNPQINAMTRNFPQINAMT